MASTNSVSRSLSFAWCLRLAILFLGLNMGCSKVLKLALHIPSLSTTQLTERLASPNAPLVVDMRKDKDYQAGHIKGAKAIPLAGIGGYLARNPLPLDRSVVLVCYRGNLSKLGASEAAAWHRGEVFDLDGGMTAWIAQGGNLEQGPGEIVPPELTQVPVRPLSLLAQGVVSALAVFVKPLYMMVCLVLIWVLAQAKSTPLRMLFWGLVCFEVGETFCALDYLFFSHNRPLAIVDLLHGLGMVAMGVLIPWGLMRLADERVVRYGDTTHSCIIQRFCGECWKQGPVSCGLHRIFLWALPAFALLSLIPLTFAPHPAHYVSQVFNTVVHYGSPIFNDLVELQLYAVIGCICFLVAWFMLHGRGPESTRRAELPFFVGIGFSSFAVFRFFLYEVFRQSMYKADFWEEITETLAMLGLGLMLYVYRKQLNLPKSQRTFEASANT